MRESIQAEQDLSLWQIGRNVNRRHSRIERRQMPSQKKGRLQGHWAILRALRPSGTAPRDRLRWWSPRALCRRPEVEDENEETAYDRPASPQQSAPGQARPPAPEPPEPTSACSYYNDFQFELLTMTGHGQDFQNSDPSSPGSRAPVAAATSRQRSRQRTLSFSLESVRLIEPWVLTTFAQSLRQHQTTSRSRIYARPQDLDDLERAASNVGCHITCLEAVRVTTANMRATALA